MNVAPQPAAVAPLPHGVQVLQRGWLSSNNVILTGRHGNAVVDTGYATHAPQTLALAEHALAGASLSWIVNTHLHSDHCGGNALLQSRFPEVRTLIPVGQSEAVSRWDIEALTYAPTGQTCSRFRFDRALNAGETVGLGDQSWEVHAAPGHDPHAVVLFDPASRTLIAGDALWQHGFGVVFPELEGVHAFEEVGRTLDLISDLRPVTVIPGHGAAFMDVDAALSRARIRLDGFVSDPAKHARHAAKVLLKFKLLEVQACTWSEFLSWAHATPYFGTLHQRFFASCPQDDWLDMLVGELEAAGAAQRIDDLILDRTR